MDPEMYKCSPPVCLNIILSHWASIPLIRYTARGGEKTLIWYTDIYDMGGFFQGKDLFCFPEIKLKFLFVVMVKNKLSVQFSF